MRYSPLGYWGATAAGLLLAVAGVVLVMVAMPGVSWPKFSAIAAIAVVATAVALYSYRCADEVILNEHKTAWFWGSMVSLSTMGPLIIGIAWQLVPVPSILLALSRIPLLHCLDGATQDLPRINVFQAGFIEGLAFVIVLQLVAFLIVLAYLRLRSAKS